MFINDDLPRVSIPSTEEMNQPENRLNRLRQEELTKIGENIVQRAASYIPVIGATVDYHYDKISGYGFLGALALDSLPGVGTAKGAVKAAVKATTKTAAKQFGKNLGTKLLSGEQNLSLGLQPIKKGSKKAREIGQAGKYGDLTKPGRFNDGLDAHHMPSKKYIEFKGIEKDDGFSAMIPREQHRKTRTYGRGGTRVDISVPYRSEIGRDLNEYITILKADGFWTPEVRRSLIQGLDNFKREFPDLFRKVTK